MNRPALYDKLFKFELNLIQLLTRGHLLFADIDKINQTTDITQVDLSISRAIDITVLMAAEWFFSDINMVNHNSNFS